MGRRKVYPFDQMEIGDHFLAPDDMGYNARHQSKRRASIIACARLYKQTYNSQFKITTKLEGGDICAFRIT